MNTNYSTFNYDNDFTPIYNIFNTNTSNNRFVGIGTHKPKDFLDIIGNVSTSNLIINNNFLYNNNINHYDSNIHLLQVDLSNKIITPNLVSSNYEETGTEWSIVNDNNIKLTLRNLNDNTRFHYNSIFFSLNSNNTNINIYLNSSFTLKYLYFIKNNNQINITDKNSISSSNFLITTNNISSTITYTNNIFKLDSFITLSQGSHVISITSTNDLSSFTVQFIGTYDYYAGSLWNKQSDLNTIISLKNVGIGTTIPQNNLHVLGNTAITNNLTINKKLTTNVLNITELHNSGITNLSHIEPITNSLIINPEKNPIGIGSTILNNFIDIGSNFKIKKNGNIIFNNLNITNNINFTKNITLSNSKSSITINNSSNIIYNLNNKTIIDDNSKHFDLNSKLIINSSNNNHTINDTMFVSGNVNILGNLTTTGFSQPFIYNPKETQLHTTLNSNNTTINNLLSSSGFLYTDNLESTSIDILDYFKVVIQNDDIPLFNYPYIFYNTQNKSYKLFNNSKIYSLTNTISSRDFTHIVKLFSNNASSITLINTNTLTTNILENNKIFMCNNAKIYLNTNSLNTEILYNNNIQYFDLF